MASYELAGQADAPLQNEGPIENQSTLRSPLKGTNSNSFHNDFKDDRIESAYHLKWIRWNSSKIPIVMQSMNGPCPLIATINVLLLREKITLPPMLEQITTDQLLTYLADSIMDCVPVGFECDEATLLNLEQNIHDAIEILPRLETGLNVNIKFTGITDFEYTSESVIFDLLRITLYHGWLIDPSHDELKIAIGSLSYNQLIDYIITNKSCQNPEVMAKLLFVEEFLELTASQLTLHGLNELRNKIMDNEIGILFRNNHFLTLFKRGDDIYTLVTDHGYLTEDNVVWESLDNIEGAGRYFNSNFLPSCSTKYQPESKTGHHFDLSDIIESLTTDPNSTSSIPPADDFSSKAPLYSSEIRSESEEYICSHNDASKRFKIENGQAYDKLMPKSNSQESKLFIDEPCTSNTPLSEVVWTSTGDEEEASKLNGETCDAQIDKTIEQAKNNNEFALNIQQDTIQKANEPVSVDNLSINQLVHSQVSPLRCNEQKRSRSVRESRDSNCIIT